MTDPFLNAKEMQIMIVKKILCAAIISIAFSMVSTAVWALPSGNYLRTCNKCYMHRGSLRCACLKRNQVRRYTRLHNARACRYIQNLNGHLTCTTPRHPYYAKRYRHRSDLGCARSRCRRCSCETGIYDMSQYVPAPCYRGRTHHDFWYWLFCPSCFN